MLLISGQGPPSPQFFGKSKLHEERLWIVLIQKTKAPWGFLPFMSRTPDPLIVVRAHWSVSKVMAFQFQQCNYQWNCRQKMEANWRWLLPLKPRGLWMLTSRVFRWNNLATDHPKNYDLCGSEVISWRSFSLWHAVWKSIMLLGPEWSQKLRNCWPV